MNTISLLEAPNGLINERQQVLEVLHDLQATEELPIIEGYTFDKRGTRHCEQGLSYHDGPTPTIGYHVLDVGIIPQGGAIDYAGYLRQTDSEGSLAIHRMIEDPILYRHLNLSDQAAGQSPVPVISFFAQANGERLHITHAQRSLFHNQAAFFHNQERARQEPELRGIVKVFQEDTQDDSLSLIDCEATLARLSAHHAAERLSAEGISLLADERGKVAVHRPLRVWPDLKNTQLLSQSLQGEVPLYDAQQLRNMQRRASGTSREFALDDIKPSAVGKLFLRLLLAPDATKRQLSRTEFESLVTYLDPDERPDGILLTNILNWARRKKLITDTISVGGKTMMQFHNLSQAICVPERPGEGGESFAYGAAVAYVQRFPRQRDDLRQFHARQELKKVYLDKEQKFTREEAAIAQRIMSRTVHTAYAKAGNRFR